MTRALLACVAALATLPGLGAGTLWDNSETAYGEVAREMVLARVLRPVLDDYDVIHGAWFDRTIPHGCKDVIKRSVARYVAAVRGDGSAELR